MANNTFKDSDFNGGYGASGTTIDSVNGIRTKLALTVTGILTAATDISGSGDLDIAGVASIGTAFTANTSADDLVVGTGGASAGITLHGSTTSECNIYFADTGNNTVGRLRYLHSSNTMQMYAGGSLQLALTSSIATFSNSVLIDGTYLKLPVKIDTGDPTSPADGWMYVNTLDNKIRVYADAAWRDLATW